MSKIEQDRIGKNLVERVNQGMAKTVAGRIDKAFPPLTKKEKRSLRRKERLQENQALNNAFEQFESDRFELE